MSAPIPEAPAVLAAFQELTLAKVVEDQAMERERLAREAVKDAQRETAAATAHVRRVQAVLDELSDAP